MTIANNAPLANADRRLMLGLGLDSWNKLIVGLAALAGVFGLLTAIATYVAFQLQKQEALDSTNTFARYKLETGERDRRS